GTQTRARRGAKLIDVSEADALSHATMSAQSAVSAGQRPGAARAAGGPPPGVTGAQIAQACAAALVVEVQTKRLALAQRRGALIARDRAGFEAFAVARGLRDQSLAWLSREP